MPPAVAAPIAAAIVGGITSTGLAYALRPKDKTKRLSEERRKSLGTFAERLAAEEEQYKEPGGGYLLRPGGQPIRFPQTSPAKRLPEQLLYES